MFLRDSDFRLLPSTLRLRNWVMPAIAPRMAAANPLRRQPASRNRAAPTDRVNRILRAGRRETTASICAEQKDLRGRNHPAINADHENQNGLERIQNYFSCLFFQQARPVERGQKIFFHVGEFFPGDGITRDQNQFHRLREFILMLPETFPQQTPRAIALHGAADFFARHDAQFRFRAVRQPLPVGDETADGEPLSLLPDACEIAARPDACGAAQAFRRCGGRGHGNQTGVRRLRPLRRRFASVALPLLLELRLRNPCWRLRRIFDG